MNQEALLILKALADPTRFQIVGYLAEENLTTGELMEKLQMSQPTIFRHMKKLKQAGIVEVCSRVNPERYRLCYPGLDLTLQQLLAGDPEGKTLEQLRQENELRRYLESRRTEDGRWEYYSHEYYAPYVLREILSVMEPGRVYSSSELGTLLGQQCVYDENLLNTIVFYGYLSKSTVVRRAKRGFVQEYVYQRTQKPIHVPL